MVVVQVIFTCIVTYLFMMVTVEESSTKSSPEHLQNGNIFHNRGHQLLGTYKEGSNRILRTYASPDGQIVTTLSEITYTKGNRAQVIFATILVLAIYSYLKLSEL